MNGGNRMEGNPTSVITKHTLPLSVCGKKKNVRGKKNLL